MDGDENMDFKFQSKIRSSKSSPKLKLIKKFKLRSFKDQKTLVKKHFSPYLKYIKEQNLKIDEMIYRDNISSKKALTLIDYVQKYEEQKNIEVAHVWPFWISEASKKYEISTLV